MSELELKYKEAIEVALEQMIKFLRKAEKDYLAGKENISGKEYLATWLQDGMIKMPMFLKLMEILNNPEADYDIILLK